MKKNLLIGTSDFRQYIRDNGYFVDKSLFIKDIWENPSRVQLITRPRRFGKTLNMTMLKYFFDNKNGTSNSTLFTGLNIMKAGDMIQHQGQYPVLFLTFKDVKFSNWNDCYEAMREEISQIYEQYETLLPSLNEREQRTYKKILLGEGSFGETVRSLKELCKYIYKVDGIRVILLIDEYDTPIHSAYIHGYYGEMMEFMRGLLSGALKDNEYLEKAVITGILRVAKESIFSGWLYTKVCS